MKRFAIITYITVAGSLFAPNVKVERSEVVSADRTSAWSPYGTVTVIDVTPPAPTAVTVTDLGNGSDVRVAWVCVDSPLITGFEVERERQLADGAWGESSMIAVDDPAARELIDAPGIGMWRYRVRSVNNRVP